MNLPSCFFRLTLKNIADKKVRFLLTTISVVLGVMFTAGVFIFADSMRSVFGSLSEDIASRTDLSVRSQQEFGERNDAAPVNPALASVIENIDGVQAISPRVTETDVVVEKDGSPLEGTANLGENWVENPNMSNTFLIDGSPPQSSSEFAINTSAVNDEDLEIGQTYAIRIPSGTRDFTLVGTFNFASADEDRNVGAYIVSFDTATAEEVLNNGRGWDSIDVDIADNADIQAIGIAIQQAVSGACASDEVACAGNLEVVSNQEIQQEQQDAFNPIINTFQTVLLVFAGIILAVSIFVIFNTFTIVLGQRVKEFGLMRALGTTSRQITTTVMGEASVVGLVASGLGMGAGVGLAYLLRWLINLFELNIPLDTIVVRWRTILIAFLVGTGVTLVSALVPALRTRRISPMSALRDDIGIADKYIEQRIMYGSILAGVGFVSALVSLFIVTTWILMLIFSVAATILFILGGRRLNPVSGRLATLALGGMFLIAARFGDYETLEQWIALAIGCGLLIIGLNLTSPLITPTLTRVIGWPIRLFARVTGRLSIENASRSPQRTTTTAAALMVGLTLVVTVSIASQSLTATWRDSLNDAVQADWMMCAGDCTTDGQPTTFSPDFAEELKTLPEIESAVSYRSIQEGLITRDASGGASAYSVFAGEFANLPRHLNLDIQEGSLAGAGEMDVAVHEDIADDEGLAVGDTKTVEFNTRQDEPPQFNIVAIYSSNIVTGTSWIISLPAWGKLFHSQSGCICFGYHS